jgi:hypothetical protein
MSFTVTISTPEQVALADVVLHVTGGELKVPRSTVLNRGSFGTLVNLSSSKTTVSDGTEVGDVWSVGAVDLKGPGTHVHGGVRSQGAVTILPPPTVLVDGPTLQNQTFTLATRLTFTIDFPPSGPPQHADGTTISLVPGAYGAAVVESDGVLLLHSGTYFFDSLEVQDGGELRVDAVGGPVRVNVLHGMNFAGRTLLVSGNASDLRVAVFHNTPITLDGRFLGELFVPLTKLTLGVGPHQGAFFAQSMELAPNAAISGFSSTPSVVHYFYGFAGQLGAGGYERELPSETLGTRVHGGGALTLPTNDVLTIEDSRTYRLSRNLVTPISSATLQAASFRRPYVLLDESAADLIPANPAADPQPRFVASGIWFGSLDDGPAGPEVRTKDWVIDRVTSPTSPDFDWDEIVLRNCTLDPGGVRADGTRLAALRLFITGRVKRLVIDRSIVGPIVVQNSPSQRGLLETLEIRDSIVDASQAPLTVTQTSPLRERPIAIFNPTGTVLLTGVTTFGDVHAGLLRASDSIIKGVVVVANTQESCLRFSALSRAELAELPPDDQRLPLLFEVPSEELVPRIEPFFFVSMRFGDPGYGALSRAVPPAIERGAENSSEMGAFSFMRRPIQLGSVLTKIDEFKPVGVLPQVIVEGESALILPTK